MKKLIICIDYDDTFSAIPELLTDFIIAAKKKGHRIIGATMRYEHEGIPKEFRKLCDQIFFTKRKAKLPFLMAQKIFPDIWIDDKPMWILNDAQ